MLVETHYVLSLAWRDAQVDMPVANFGISEVHDEPMPKAVEDYFVKVLGLYFPVANHTRRETLPLYTWDVQRTRVIVRMVRAALHLVHDVVIMHVPRPVFMLFDNILHVLMSPAFPIYGFTLSFTVFVIIAATLSHRAANS